MSGEFNPDIHVPGVWRCAKCTFVLVQSNLNMGDGSVTARDAPGDRCPNDGSPMWRVTWKERAIEAEQSLERTVIQTEMRIVQLLTDYYQKEIGVLMHQAEHWAEHGKPLAVHHRVMAADQVYQIVALMKRCMEHKDDPFGELRRYIGMKDINPPGSYPPKPEIHQYRDVRFVAELLGDAPPAAPIRCGKSARR